MSSPLDSSGKAADGEGVAAAASGAPKEGAEAGAGSPPKGQILAASEGGVSYYVKPPASGDTSKQSSYKRSRMLEEIVGVHTDGPYGRRKGEAGHSVEDYLMFVNLVE